MHENIVRLTGVKYEAVGFFDNPVQPNEDEQEMKPDAAMPALPPTPPPAEAEKIIPKVEE